jgi:hypothetical protein
MRKFVIAAAAVVSMVAVVGLAPSALALNESVEVSSVSAGVPISGSASLTLTGSTDAVFQINFPTELFASDSFGYYQGDAGNCFADYGLTLTLNENTLPISYCESSFIGGSPDVTALFVSAETVRANAGGVLTLTWNSSYTSSIASLAGATVWVYDTVSQENVPVVLTSLPASPLLSEAPILMWQQAYGRASASDTCLTGYTPSWDTWPNGGKGGFVCNRFVPEYGN